MVGALEAFHGLRGQTPRPRGWPRSQQGYDKLTGHGAFQRGVGANWQAVIRQCPGLRAKGRDYWGLGYLPCAPFHSCAIGFQSQDHPLSLKAANPLKNTSSHSGARPHHSSRKRLPGLRGVFCKASKTSVEHRPSTASPLHLTSSQGCGAGQGRECAAPHQAPARWPASNAPQYSTGRNAFLHPCMMQRSHHNLIRTILRTPHPWSPMLLALPVGDRQPPCAHTTLPCPTALGAYDKSSRACSCGPA